MPSAITDREIRLLLPRPKKYKVSAGDGVALIVMPDGAKYWRWRYRYAGIQNELTLGRPYPATSLREARTEALRLRQQLTSGTNPAEVRAQDKASRKEARANNFSEAAEQWFAHRSKFWSLRTQAQARMYLDKDMLPSFAKRTLDSISTREIAAFITKIEGRGAPDIAKKTRQWLTKIFEYARAFGWTKSDPVKDVGVVISPSKHAESYPHLTEAELPEFIAKLKAFPSSEIVKCALRVCLLTANRPGVVRTLRWSELDLESGIWEIKKNREGMKRGYHHITPLPSQVIQMLVKLQSQTGDSEYVFPGRNDPDKPLSDGAINALLKRLGYRGRQTAHGFRHLLSTSLNDRGWNSDWIERQLAHGDPETRGDYNFAFYLDGRKEMMQAWADIVEGMEGDANAERASL